MKKNNNKQCYSNLSMIYHNGGAANGDADSVIDNTNNATPAYDATNNDTLCA